MDIDFGDDDEIEVQSSNETVTKKDSSSKVIDYDDLTNEVSKMNNYCHP